MAASNRFAKGRKVKNPGAAVIKQMLRAINELEKSENGIKTGFKIKSAASFTNLKTLTTKFPVAAAEAHVKTLASLALEIKIALTEAMNSKVYDWTYGDGDIVQSGALRDSVEVVSDKESIMVRYSAKNETDGYDYAGIVYFGGYIHPYGNPNVTVYMPGRPWVKHVLTGGGPVPKFPLTERYLYYFEQFFKEELPK